MALELKKLTIAGKSLLDIFYPVGTIYETVNNTFNPSTEWGGGGIK